MIRVVIRHMDQTGSMLLGDFPPSELPALRELIAGTEVYWDADEDSWNAGVAGRHMDDQLVTTSDGGRLIYEIVLIDAD